MGDSRNNPRSPAFVSSNPPRHLVGARLEAVKVPTKAWLEAHPNEDAEPGDEDWEVSIIVIGQYVEPSALVAKDKWVGGEAMVCELFENKIPLSQFAGIIKKANPTLAWRPDRTVTIEGLDS